MTKICNSAIIKNKIKKSVKDHVTIHYLETTPEGLFLEH